jgi:hypothetical protein
MEPSDILQAVQGLSPTDLEAAWEYAATNAEEIDRAIRENEEGEEGFVEWGRMLLYADEDFSLPVVEELRFLGHDVVTAQEDGRTSALDPVILARAHSLGRSVLTYNRRHFERLHKQGADHSGILSATHDRDFPALADRIHQALAGLSPARWCIRVNKPASP